MTQRILIVEDERAIRDMIAFALRRAGMEVIPAEDALAAQQAIGERDCEKTPPLALRIGIGTGPVVAGVVGRKKFIYDLWGDTVNIASRLTSEGQPGLIQCDERSYRQLEGHFGFDLPVVLTLKGKGKVRVYRLAGPIASPPGSIGSSLSPSTAG